MRMMLIGLILVGWTAIGPTSVTWAEPGDAPWTAVRAQQWYHAQPWLVGCNFLPSSAVNDVEMWQRDTFDTETIDRELGWARGLGFNTVRVFLMPGMEAKLKICTSYGRPVLCTEWLVRRGGNTFEELLPMFRERKIGCWCWGLVAGRTQTNFPWGSPPQALEPTQWQHDILRADGTPYRDHEVRFIRVQTGKLPASEM